MKKLLIILSLGLALFSLNACNEDKKETTTKTMKCDAGKCDASKEKTKETPAKKCSSTEKCGEGKCG